MESEYMLVSAFKHVNDTTPLDEQQKAEQEAIQNHSTKFLLYDHLTKEVLKGSRKLVPDFKTELVQRIEANPTILHELVRIDRLDAIFTAFYSSNESSIDKALATDDNYKYSATKDYYFEYDKLIWRAEIRYNKFSFKGTDFKGVYIKLINDGFIYTKQYLNDNLKYAHERHKISSWYTLPANVISQSFQSILNFATKKIGLSTNKPAFFYSYADDRLDIQIKDFGKRLSLSITYEYGSPTHDFDDYWEDK
jgi:hypothetical protein